MAVSFQRWISAVFQRLNNASRRDSEDYDDWYIEADGRDINYARFVEGVIPPELQDDERIEDMVFSMHAELGFLYGREDV